MPHLLPQGYLEPPMYPRTHTPSARTHLLPQCNGIPCINALASSVPMHPCTYPLCIHTPRARTHLPPQGSGILLGQLEVQAVLVQPAQLVLQRGTILTQLGSLGGRLLCKSSSSSSSSSKGTGKKIHTQHPQGGSGAHMDPVAKGPHQTWSTWF
eukprot:1161829-Pelagomonas_calceolata.AAC.14